ncbi:MAG: AAA domain-containing protein [Sedimentibacter sp.]
MNSIYKDIFKAVHEGRWLSIEYKNKENNITKYWIGIKNIDPKRKMLLVDGLHLSQFSLLEMNIYIDSILKSAVIDGSYCQINRNLVDDIRLHPQKYKHIFYNAANLKILNYLADCNKLDSTPYNCNYSLIKYFDRDSLVSGSYRLNEDQFKEIVDNFQYKATSPYAKNKIKQLCVNVLSINTNNGLYVLAYRRLNLDVVNRKLKADEEITICLEYSIDGNKQSIRQFLDGEDYSLLDEFEKNQELIKDKITNYNPQYVGVDDMPYIIAIGLDVIIDLDHEYEAIIDMYNSDIITVPIKAFFGDFVKRSEKRKEYPIALLNKKVNIDQLLAINTAMKYPIAYIQGPPGTGKTNTIINTITTAFFNEKTVLFASYNNHPIDSVYKSFLTLKYRDRIIPFPIIRLGNNEKVAGSLDFIKEIYERTKKIDIYDKTLEKNKGNKIERTKKLTALLKKHEKIIDLKERKETIEKLLSTYDQFTFQTDLQGRQLYEVEKLLESLGEVTDEEAVNLLSNDEDEFFKYLYYTSAKYIKRLDEPKYKDLLDIVYLDDKELQLNTFNQYLKEEENLRKFLRIFPICATTCISAHKLGEPKQYFDMVIMDEASQCNTAISLVPIIRGENLMLVGDPQQLNPVVLLNQRDNFILKKKYSVTNEYDYINNSIYKTYLACDAVSDEILLSYHYRCHKKIIDFNNKKYYNGKLNIKSNIKSEQPLVFVDVGENKTGVKNTSVSEAQKIIEYVNANRDKRIGIITPFTNQNKYINSILQENGIDDITCGTVHAFQGDEKDVIIFSLAVTDNTSSRTYEWLKNNKELINVATSRAKEQLIIMSSRKNIDRLHEKNSDDDVYDLIEYVKSNGEYKVAEKTTASRALGVKPYSTETEEAFLQSLKFALDNVLYNKRKCTVHKEVSIAHVFQDNYTYNDLFYSGRFDFVVYERVFRKREIPILAIELDGKEHIEDVVVRERDKKKNEICRKHGFELIRIENSYSRRYNYIKEILIDYFTKN